MGVIFKPSTSKGPVLLLDHDTSEAPTITLSNGKVIKAKKAGQGAPGSYHTSEEGSGYQWVFPSDILNQEGATLTADGKSQKIGSTNSSWRGESIGSLSESSKGAIGSSGSTNLGSAPGGLNPVPFGAGFSPAFLGGQVPQFQPIKYSPIGVPDFNLIDPAEYQSKYGSAARGEFVKDFGLSDDLALSTLSTELAGLKNFVPAASALKREQTAVDNLFNQAQRTSQIDRALPGVRGDLAAQGERAKGYAEGRLGNSIDDRGFELGLRSQSADISRTRGFGDDSTVARKASDLLSAKERFQVSQYGEQLLGTNINTRSALELAPTEYSNAGSSINPVPSISGSQLRSQYATTLSSLSSIPAQTALASRTGQESFKTNLNLDVSKYNTTNTIGVDEYNHSNVYSSQLNAFNYLQGYASNLADLGTAEVNQQRDDQIRQQLMEQFKKGQGDAQRSQNIKNILGTLGNVPGAIQSIISLFTGGDSSGTNYSGGYKDPLTIDINKEFSPFGNLDYNSPSGGANDFKYDTNTGDFNIPDEFGVSYNNEFGLGVDINQFNEDIGYGY